LRTYFWNRRISRKRKLLERRLQESTTTYDMKVNEHESSDYYNDHDPKPEASKVVVDDGERA